MSIVGYGEGLSMRGNGCGEQGSWRSISVAVFGGGDGSGADGTMRGSGGAIAGTAKNADVIDDLLLVEALRACE